MTDSAAKDVDGYTSNVKPQNEHQRKRVSCETWWNYSPVNTTRFGVENIIKFQIPTTDVIFDMSRAFITVDYLLPVYVAHVYNGAGDTLVNNLDDLATKLLLEMPRFSTYLARNEITALGNNFSFPGILDAATIFSLTEMYMDGNLIWHNDYCQTQSRLWALNKNDQWIDSQNQTYFRPSIEEDLADEQHTIQTIFAGLYFKQSNIVPNVNIGDELNTPFYIKRQLKIPLVSLYPQFEVMNGWPSFLVKQILYLQLTVSDVRKYLVTFYSNQFLKGPFNVNDIDNYVFPNGQDEAKYENNNPFKPIFRYYGSIWGREQDGHDVLVGHYSDVVFDLANVVLDNPILYLPAHIPEFKERAEYIQMVNSGLNYGFKYYNVLSNTTFFKHGQQTDNTMSLMYNSAVNNLEAVNLLVLRDTNEVIYEKPAIGSIQVNLGNSWMLAPSGTHVPNLFTQDSNLLRDLLKGWGQNDKNYMQTVSSDVIRDYKMPSNYIWLDFQSPDAIDDPEDGQIVIAELPNKEGYAFKFKYDAEDEDWEMTAPQFCPIFGAYVLYFDVSPGDELGVAAGQYARLINIRWTNEGLPNHENEIGLRNTLENAKLYVCQQTFNTITITPTGVYIKNPFADEFSVQKTITTYSNLNYDESGLRTHGAFAVQHGIGSFFKKIGRGVKKIWRGAKKAGQIASQIAPMLPEGAQKYVDKYNHIIGTGDKIIGTGQEIYDQWKNGNKQHGAMKFRVKAMRHLGPDGYREYQHKIEKYANKGWSHGILMRKLRKSWAKKQGVDGLIIPKHGVEKYLPGTKIRRFQFSGIPRVTPGWRGRINNRPPRLQPFGRFISSIPAANGSMDTKHGLCSPYHGFLSAVKDVAKKYWHEHVPDSVQEAVKPFEEPAKELMSHVKEKGKEYLRHKLDPTTYHNVHSAYKIGRKLWHRTGLSKLASRAIRARYTGHGRKAYKKWASRTTHPAVFLGAPHGKSMNKFYAKHYGKKMANRALKLERAMWNGGNKRVNDGQF